MMNPALLSSRSPHFPLSIQQSWMWQLLRRYPDWKCAVTYTFGFRGGLNYDRLDVSLKELQSRHTSLRTRIVTMGGTASQIVDGCSNLHVPRETVLGITAAEVEENAQRRVMALCDQNIDIACGPLVDFRLLKLSADEHWLIMRMHRMIADCFSMDQAFHEALTLYRSDGEEKPISLSTATKQYTDYALWQRDSADDWLLRHGSYWKRRLAGAAPVNWPEDLATRTASSSDVGKMGIFFGKQLSADIHTFSRRAKTLSAIVMLSSYAAVILRRTEQLDFVIPFNVAGRQSRNKSVLGYFSHVLYLRIELQRSQTFSNLVSQMANEFFRALSHQDFGKVSTEHPEFMGGTFFQWISWHLDEQESEAPRESVEGCPSVHRIAVRDFGEGLTALPPGLVDVELTVFDTVDGIHLSGTYRRDRFEAETMAGLAREIRNVTETLVASPEASIGGDHYGI